MADHDNMISGHFAQDFMWGTATAAYQIEGAWAKDGKSPSVWDVHAHTKNKIEDGRDADVACDSYHNWKEDIKLIKAMNNTHYRFSVSWPRILPTGDASAPSPTGVAYYNELIDALLAENVKPCVTLYHWDLPQCLQEKGGWQSDDIIEKFKEYSRFCFDQFGDRVKLWITVNEPHIYAALGFAAGTHAPGIKDPFRIFYAVSRTFLLAHAATWRMYDREYRSKQNGQISMTFNSDWAEPKNSSDEKHQESAELYLQTTLGWFAHPIFVDGDYPPMLKELIARRSKNEGLAESRLPSLSNEEKKLIKGTHDFFGINHYTARLCEPVSEKTQAMLMHPDLEAFVYPNPEWERAGSHWLYVTPWGFRKLLNYIAKNYGNPQIIVTENGCSTKHPVSDPGDTKQLNDSQRCRYLTSYVNEALKAYLIDGVDLRGYFVWSLMDNFEWAAGYSERFGIHHVDFEDPKRTRTPRKSALVYSKIVKENGFNEAPILKFSEN